MARNHANNGRVYRAVITIEHLDGSHKSTVTYGPYDSKAPAKALISRAVNAAEASREKRRNLAYAFTAVGHIESAEVVWAPIKEDSP